MDDEPAPGISDEARGLRHETALDDAPPAVEGGAIAGRAADFEGLPLVGVRVEAAASGDEGSLDALPVLTDGEGRFCLEGLVAPAYDLRFQMGTVKARVLCVPAGTTDLAVRLARPQGLVVDARVRPGEAPPDVLHLVLERQGQAGWVREHVGRSLRKRLLLWNLRPGTYRLLVWGPPWLPVRAEGLEVTADAEAPDVVLDLAAPGARLGGRLLGPDGEGASGWITWRRTDAVDPLPAPLRSIAVSDRGTWRIDGLEPGSYTLSALTAAGQVAQAAGVVVGPPPAAPDGLLLHAR